MYYEANTDNDCVASCIVQFQKISIPAAWKVNGNSEGVKILKSQFFFKGKYRASLEFLKGWGGGGGGGGFNPKPLLWKGMDIFWTTHCNFQVKRSHKPCGIRSSILTKQTSLPLDADSTCTCSKICKGRDGPAGRKGVTQQCYMGVLVCRFCLEFSHRDGNTVQMSHILVCSP